MVSPSNIKMLVLLPHQLHCRGDRQGEDGEEEVDDVLARAPPRTARAAPWCRRESSCRTAVVVAAISRRRAHQLITATSFLS